MCGGTKMNKILSKKIMITLVAGNMLCMSSAWAALYWYGDKDNSTQWKSSTSTNPADTILSGAILTLDENTIVDGKHVGDVTGFCSGYSSAGTVSDNSITVVGGYFTGTVTGGKSYNGIVCDNSITISGGTTGDVYGGNSNTGKVKNNTVSISNGKVGKVYGGYLSAEIFGNLMSENAVTISGGTIGSIYGGFVYGERATSADKNTVTMVLSQ